MKKNINLFMMMCLSLLMFTTSCDEEVTEYKEGVLLSVDPVLEITNTLFSFQSEGTYNTSFKIIPGRFNTAVKLNVYKVFTDGDTEAVSDRVLAYSYDLEVGSNSVVINEEITYEELRADITVNGNPLPVDPEEIAPNSKWVLDIELLDASGNIVLPYTGADIAISKNPYAGSYEVIYTDYWRAYKDVAGDGSPLPEWTGEIRDIGALSANVLIHPDWVGPFATAPAGAAWTIVLDLETEIAPNEYALEIPLVYDGTTQPFGGSFGINCTETPENFPNVPCVKKLVVDPINGEHELHLTYGYFTVSADPTANGPREFTEILKKIVD